MLLAASALFAQFKNQASWTRGNRNIKNPLPPKPIKVVLIGSEAQELDNLKKITCLVILFYRKLQVCENSPKSTIFGIFNELLSIQNVNVARFARHVECDFFCDFSPL